MTGTDSPTALRPLDIEFVPADYCRLVRREEIFPDTGRPLELDVGCGDGTFLLGMAAQFPDRDFLGIERLNGRVQKICRKAARLGLRNVRVLCLESQYTLGWLLPDGIAARLHLLFPDPWPKKRHHKKRFVQDESLQAIHRVLRPDGEFLFKTDHEEYFASSGEVMAGCPLFSALPWIGAEEFYPVTDFERQWMEQGCLIQGARWRKVSGNAPPGSADGPVGE